MSEALHPVGPDNPGFDPAEPSPRGLLLFILGMVTVIAAVMISMTGLYRYAHEKQEEEAVLSKPSEELAALRAREDQQLNSYGFIGKDKSAVQIPIGRAMELLAKEAAEGKVKYSTAPTPVKKVEDDPAPRP